MHLETINAAIAQYCYDRNIAYDLTVDFESVMKLPAALIEVKEEAFFEINAERIDLPATVQSIGNKAFAEDPSLLLITIPGADVAIAEDAFENSEKVTIMAPSGGTVKQFAESCSIPFIPAQ